MNAEAPAVVSRRLPAEIFAGFVPVRGFSRGGLRSFRGHFGTHFDDFSGFWLSSS